MMRRSPTACRVWASLLILVALCAAATRVDAHQLGIATLDIERLGAAAFRVELRHHRSPDRAANRLDGGARCRVEGPAQHRLAAPDAVALTWTLHCRDGMGAPRLRLSAPVDGIVVLGTDAGGLVKQRYHPTPGGMLTLRLDSTAEQPLAVLRHYALLGAEHILGGPDHLLFVTALLVLAARPGRLLWAVTGFTAAHSVTLALATLGWIDLPQASVDVLIALSLALLGGEILQRGAPHGTPLPVRQLWLYAVVFGLFHGLGFAGSLRSIGFPDDNLPLALLAFNLGVEAGQLLFVALIGSAAMLIMRALDRRPTVAARLVGYLVGISGTYWMLQRGAPILIG